jgi:hypothetical protein
MAVQESTQLSKQIPKSKGPKSLKEAMTQVEASKKNKDVPVVNAEISNTEVSSKKNIIKEKTPEEKQKAHREGIIKTIVAVLLGISSGLIVFNMYGAGEDRVWYALITIILALTYYAQRLIYPAIQIDTKEFKFKDWFYVEFLVLDFCLVTWTLLLN